MVSIWESFFFIKNVVLLVKKLWNEKEASVFNGLEVFVIPMIHMSVQLFINYIFLVWNLFLKYYLKYILLVNTLLFYV